MKSLIIMCTLFLASLAGPGHTAQVNGVLITGHGLLAAELTQTGLTAQGEPLYDPKKKLAIARTAEEIPARRGLSFGVSFVVQGSPAGAQVPLDVVLTHPPYAMPGGRPFSESSWRQDVKLGQTHYAGEIFDADHKLVPGPWVLKIFFHGKLMAEQTFTVVNP